MARISLLLTGATGYVGGSVLATLLASKQDEDVMKDVDITVLVRGNDKAKVYNAMGVKSALFDSFDDTETIKGIAREHDIVIHTASGFHVGCAETLITGLKERKAQTGTEVFYLHTSGTTSLADSPLLGLYPEYPTGITFSDNNTKQVISTWEYMNKRYQYQQRTTDLRVIQSGKEKGIRTFICVCPMIYGQGSGIFNRDTRQVTELIKLASREGQLSIVGDGSGVKCHIHVQDIASFFSTLLISLLRGKSVPYSDEGVFFIENGTHTWKEVGEGVAKAGHDLSLVNTSEVKCMTLEEASTKLNMSNKEWTESAYVSSARVSGDKARSLGWKPKYPSSDYYEHFGEDWMRLKN